MITPLGRQFCERWIFEHSKESQVQDKLERIDKLCREIQALTGESIQPYWNQKPLTKQKQAQLIEKVHGIKEMNALGEKHEESN